ncbi:hypothetical protein WA538_005318 [Blastocystis sp. DL]
MPVLLDCLRKDIYSLISKLNIPQDDQVQIGKLIEQIRLEEARTISAREEIANLKRQYSELQSLQGEKEDSGKTNGVVSSSPTTDNASLLHDVQERIQSLKNDLMNISMEARLSIELEMRDNKAIVSSLSRNVDSLSSRYQELNDLYVKECARRRRVFNELQDLRGSIRVFCRIRPLIPQETARSEEVVVSEIDDNSLQIRLAQSSVDSGKGQRRSEKIYEYDRVFGPSSTQSEVFSEMQGLVTSVLDGYSACIFAYGQTGSGKTYTMEGLDTQESLGVIPRTFVALSEEMTTRKACSFTCRISMVEIYNEKIYDLLGNNMQVDARLSPEGSVVFPSAVSSTVSSVAEMNEVLARGNLARHVAATASNEHSSRSHMLFFLTVESLDEASQQRSRGRLVLVDLAGSERVAKTESTGQRLVEGQYINKSLSSLGDVIHALNNKHKHIPFRNSTLTFVLQDVLQEGNKVLMIAQLSPAASNAQESLQSLEFANRVNRVTLGRSTGNKTHPMIAKLTDANAKLRGELDAAKQELEVLRGRSDLSASALSQSNERLKSVETLLSEKNDQVSVFLSPDRELSKANVRIEELEADVAGKTRLLQDRTQEVKQLKEQMEQVETELRTRKSDAPRDSFGSFVDTHNVRATRRFSTIGLPSTHTSRLSSPPPVMRRSIASAGLVGSARATEPLGLTGSIGQAKSAESSGPSASSKTSVPSEAAAPNTHTKSQAIATRSAAAHPTASAPQKRSYTMGRGPSRRISLIERSRMASASAAPVETMPTPPVSAPVTGVVRLGASHRVSTSVRRFSAVPKKPEPATEEKSVEEEAKRPRVSPPARKEGSKPSYTYTPSSNRHVALDHLLKSQKTGQEGDSEPTSFLSYRKQENMTSFLSTSGSSQNNSLIK